MFLLDLKTIINKLNAITQFNAVVAGGCLRDLLYGMTPKDIDVFVVVPPDFEYGDAIKATQALADALYENEGDDEVSPLEAMLAVPHVRPKGSSSYDDFKLRNEVLHVIGIPKTLRYPDIDIIFMNEEIVGERFVSDTFDFSINMVEYDGSDIYKSPAFVATQQSKNITQCRDNVDCNAERTKIRIDKLTQKFPDHTWTFLDSSV